LIGLIFYQQPVDIQETSMAIRPLHDRVVIKRLEAEEKTASGIVLPGAAAEKPDMGEVIAVGNGKVLDNGERRALELKVGDKVIFGKYSGQTVKLDGDEVLVLREEDVMAIVE
jgi:chaperonin GroES